MRRAMFGAAVVGVGVLTVVSGGVATAQQPAEGSLQVQAVTGLDRLPVTGLDTSVTSCAAGPVLATLTTGRDGTVTRNFPDGCYRVEVTAVPGGCQLGSITYVQVEVQPGTAPVAEFRLHCA
ncbi:hypothetical protein [Nocardia australiensis]|uniref:hypothetical protein n=1 Tax=Nocardia australiensis TaxID=2887191 RepID=UPI001D14DE97|nr:hypothetical protein [Nocardia australiensis]